MGLSLMLYIKRDHFIQMNVNRQKKLNRLLGKVKKDYASTKKWLSISIPLISLFWFIIGFLAFLNILQAK